MRHNTLVGIVTAGYNVFTAILLIFVIVVESRVLCAMVRNRNTRTVYGLLKDIV